MLELGQLYCCFESSWTEYGIVCFITLVAFILLHLSENWFAGWVLLELDRVGAAYYGDGYVFFPIKIK